MNPKDDSAIQWPDLNRAHRVQSAKHSALTYMPGARVIDKATGELGTVMEGGWYGMGSAELYQVHMDNGTVATRDVKELTPSPIAEGVSLDEFDNPKL